MNKRDFIKFSGLATAGLLTGNAWADANASAPKGSPTGSPEGTLTSGLDALTSMTGDVIPISREERLTRIANAQAIMTKQNIDAIVLEPGAAMVYFSGIQWWRSERLTAMVIPKTGDVAVVCPFFEEPSIRESLQVGEDVRVWQEHESPFAQVVAILNDRGIPSGRVGFEHSVRFFVSQGIVEANPKFVAVSAEPVTRGCRMYKTAHELALMHRANAITLTAYQFVYGQLREGMSQGEVKSLMNSAMSALGGEQPWSLALFNEASAYPHGTRQSQVIGKGSVVLMDCGCAVQGYQADISRTFVFGEPSVKQQKIWNIVREGQRVAMAAAKVGKSAGAVDDAVRAYYLKEGYGPDYTLPGLSHRTGHGIGMEGHESVNFVRGESTPLNPGMCFSNEPGIYIPGEFGVRLEDCLYITSKGPVWFTEPPTSLSEPLGKIVPLQSL
ncbi:aminopeptidase P family protein [Aestuariibacter sp. GS-14]|uniref:M24 family metallopeptidase n=1 Tax=Aestuariibacter sp. GS-14 TaxID=2590670 RepID=UPI00112DCADF|nr:Xaa-Pro peptidase family protein [Aestuariibacter sp. GS-14]TPV62173.1 aminopeptidase P family protein [Aestuariibacter sp. GS-14]